MEIKLDKKKISDFFGKVKNELIMNSKYILIFFAAVALGYCGYLWYKFVSRPTWSAEKRQEYISATENKTNFDRKKFDAVVAEILRRKSEFGIKMENVPDIFRLK